MVSIVPFEMLDRIFSELDDTAHIAEKFGIRRLRHLHPLLFVCKEWQSVAERRLYASVDLGLGWSHITRRMVAYQCEAFYYTVKTNPYLASLVRKIFMAISFHSREDSFRHAQVLRLCTNVQYVRIGGFNNNYLDDLNTALAQRDLIGLNFERVCPSKLEVPRSVIGGTGRVQRSMVFRTTSEIIRYLLDFPHLQRLSYTAVGLDDRDCKFDDDDILPSPSSVKGCCPALHTIDIRGNVLKSKHLLFLAEIAPDVKYADMPLTGQSADALRACLQSWHLTLTHLSLMLLEPNSGCSLEQVADALRNVDAFRPLRRLELRLDPNSLRDQKESARIQVAGVAVRDACKKRKIRMVCPTYLF